ncbi:MAG: hypothetical protein WA418_34910 [Bradyrhizobium sp.]
MTCEQVAHRYSVTEYFVRQVWEDSRNTGRLPDTPRPHFVEVSAPEVDFSAPISSAEIAEDERAADAAHDANVTCSAALLAALRKHHPDNAKAHDVPCQWLAGELRRVPTQEELRRMRHFNLDRY